mgnify:CR=1 FL=1
MGRIKSTLVKRTAEKLVQEQEFYEEFEKNKKILDRTMPSKRIRNMIAGYITQLVKREHAKRKILDNINKQEVNH